MFPITVDQLAQLLGASSHPLETHALSFPQLRDVGEETLEDTDCPSDGRLSNRHTRNQIISGATIDSRSIAASSSAFAATSAPVFFAIAGEKTHGVTFASDALRNGAACVVTDRPISGSDRLDASVLHVPSSVHALQTLGHWNRRQFNGLCVGITGSVGKTTTRQMIHDVLKLQFKGVQSPRNFNNELGVPLTLCELQADHDFCVVEMGAGRRGDIAALATLAEPEFGVVTRVAPAHLSSMGSIEGIRQTKQELIESLPARGHAFLNADDPLVRSMTSVCRSDVTLFGTCSDADVQAREISFRSGITQFVIDGVSFHLHGGSHLITSALAAISIGRLTGIATTQIAEAVDSFRPDVGRGRVVATSPWTVIDDSYNASPASVAACIQNLSAWSTSAHRILVLGDMLELGDESEAMHRDVGRLIAQSSIAHTLVFGSHADTVASSARQSGLPQNRVSVFRDMETLKLVLDCLLRNGDIVWIKGSRGVAMEHVVQHLLATSAPTLLRAA
jgi:UDP-N-acetylmuramoyl-tripeptide--D-alanyl-D-alanine ligase